MTRRTNLDGTLAAVVGVLATTATMLAQQPTHDHGAAMPQANAAVSDVMSRDLERLNRATARFSDPAEAVRAGYPAVTNCVAHPSAGAMGLHYTSQALSDATLDVEKPEVLVYERRADGTLKLNGVEYLVPIAAWTRPEPPRILGQDLKRSDPLGIWYLHVWNWTTNPSGLFADWNPDVTCRS